MCIDHTHTLVPRNSDYTCEHGAQRNFEPWRATDDKKDEDKLARLEEEENDPMAALENKAVDSKREMDILDALQSIKSRNARLERAGKEDSERILEHVSSRTEVGDSTVEVRLSEYEAQRKREEEEDEEEVRRVFGRAYLDGVPDIELDHAGTDGPSSATSSSAGSEPNTPTDGDEAAPAAGGSGSNGKANPDMPPTMAAAVAAAKAAAVKRKLDAVEPSAAMLLTDEQKSIVSKGFSTMPPPKKKKGNSALANKLGIKLKK